MDHFLKLDGVAGESNHMKHEGEIEVLSWAWGLSTGATSGGSGSGRGASQARPNDLTFTHRYDRASPELLRLAATGRHVKLAILSATQQGGKGDAIDFFKVTMKDVRVSGVAQSASSDEIHEVVTIWPQHIEFQYRQRRPDGSLGSSITVAWDTRDDTVT